MNGTWGAPELIRTPDASDDTQSILLGNPHLVLNRSENVAHVVLVWWARTDYEDCP